MVDPAVRKRLKKGQNYFVGVSKKCILNRSKVKAYPDKAVLDDELLD